MLRAEIRVKGRVAEHWSDWFEDFEIAHTDQGEMVLTGAVVDQAALYGLIAKLRDLGLPLVSVRQVGDEEWKMEEEEQK
jgi:molybdopterin-biosynthesis enzyme MoeA-like protein